MIIVRESRLVRRVAAAALDPALRRAGPCMAAVWLWLQL
jgi:hypothetical protein